MINSHKMSDMGYNGVPLPSAWKTKLAVLPLALQSTQKVNQIVENNDAMQCQKLALFSSVHFHGGCHVHVIHLQNGRDFWTSFQVGISYIPYTAIRLNLFQVGSSNFFPS